MKARIENGQIKIYNILPKTYNGITSCYPGDFHLQSDDIHSQEGFKPVIIPTFDSQRQELGELYYNETEDIFTYPVIDKVLDLEVLRQQKQNELSAVMDEFAVLITRCKLIHGEDNADLNNAIEQTRQMKDQTLTNLNAITTIDEMLIFEIEKEDVDYYKSLFEPFKL